MQNSKGKYIICRYSNAENWLKYKPISGCLFQLSFCCAHYGQMTSKIIKHQHHANLESKRLTYCRKYKTVYKSAYLYHVYLSRFLSSQSPRHYLLSTFRCLCKALYSKEKKNSLCGWSELVSEPSDLRSVALILFTKWKQTVYL